jgi:Nickel uptake substrate-specific transmembrane region.
MKVLLALLALTASAQDLYLMPERFVVSPGERIKVGIHSGKGFPESETCPDVELLEDPSMYAGALAYNMTSLRAEDRSAAVSVTIKGAGSPVLTIRTKPQVLELEPKKFEQHLRDEGLDTLFSGPSQNGGAAKAAKMRRRHYAKAVLLAERPDETYKRRTGQILEFVPQRDPYSLKPGETLPVELLFRGKPEEGVRVERSRSTAEGTDSVVLGRTNAKGLVEVPIDRAGKWRLRAIVMERSSEPGIDWETFLSSLTFEIQ